MNNLQRFFNSIDFVERSLFSKLSVDRIAREAHFSTYHYCRMFKAIVGESVMVYVRKRRLTEAAELLAKTDTPILTIALECQFDSQEAFTRAFKNQFKETPGKYRKLNERFKLLYKNKFDHHTLEHRHHVITMEPTLITKPELNVIGIPSIYQYDDFDIIKLWSAFKKRKEEISNVALPINGFGIYENYLEGSGENAHTVFTYLCCVGVTTLSDIPNGMVGRVIPEQLYAVFTHRGSVTNIDNTLRYIWGDWLPASGYTYASRPDFELYSDRYSPENKKSEIDLYIPIKKA